MTEPRFHVGQHVAVCNSALSIVIPQTAVTDVCWRKPGHRMLGSDGREWTTNGHWSYEVRHSPMHPAFGVPIRFAEWCLRPINPDTEYLPTSTETPISQEEKV